MPLFLSKVNVVRYYVTQVAFLGVQLLSNDYCLLLFVLVLFVSYPSHAELQKHKQIPSYVLLLLRTILVLVGY